MQFTQTSITCTRKHTISCGHRVEGHESKCANFHGHNYTIEITCAASELDKVGRVIDFSKIKDVCCYWLEENWDHKFLMWERDEYANIVNAPNQPLHQLPGIVLVPFNPTAENMAQYLVALFDDRLLRLCSIRCIKVVVHETPKCSASAERYIVNSDER